MQEANAAGEVAPLAMSFRRTQKRNAVHIQESEDVPASVAVAALSGGAFLSENGQDIAMRPSKKALVIAPISNTYRIGMKGQPSFVPPASDAPVAGGEGEDRFVKAATTLESTIKEYGLQKVDRKTDQQIHANGGIAERLKNEKEGRGIDDEDLPDMSSVEAYEAMPIEEFGMAMLRGMGWKEGMGVGRNRQVVEAIEYLKRPERLGLGAQSAGPISKPKGPRKMGDAPIDQQTRREDLVLAPDADGRQRHVRKLDEKLVKREDIVPGPRKGKEMVVSGGRHQGLKCLVVEGPVSVNKEGGEGQRHKWTVRLRPSDEEAIVWEEDLGEVGSLMSGENQRPSGEEKMVHGSRVDNQIKIKDEPGVVSAKGKTRDSHTSLPLPPPPATGSSKRDSEAKPSSSRTSWLHPNIKVRVIDKRMNQGRTYLKKGVVLDVHPGSRADVRLDETREVLSLMPQDSLETVIPKGKGEALLIVGGKMRGSKGRLLQAKTDEGVAAVQLASDLTVHQLMLDDICMFMGSLDEDED